MGGSVRLATEVWVGVRDIETMKEISLTIDGKKLTTNDGNTVLWTALENDIYIPNLCALRERPEAPASCRLCFVEVEGGIEPVTACTESVKEGMVVHTKGKFAQRIARTAAELLLSNHPLDCSHCLKSRSCELLKIAKHLGIKVKANRFKKLERNLPIDDSLSIFTFDPNKCVLCGKCVWACQEQLGVGAIGFTRRGFKRVVSTYQDEPLAESRCTQCGECVKVCPIGALTFKATK
jgi:bidirectional [NiFe] hydrogenase diaphorase subunit